jgi:uncharacterized protein YdeI (YjbR/CyaY-like superfamily)
MEKNKKPVHGNEKWSRELEYLAKVMLKAPLEKTIKWGAEVFTYNGKNVISYYGFKDYFALWFYKGIFLTDKYKVLFSAQGGDTKSLRQWRFASIEDVDEQKILEYIHEAIEVEKKGLKMKPVKPGKIEFPGLLSEAMSKNPDLHTAFNSLTPGKQREYVAYINEAKQDATRIKRLEKISPMILRGVGLNDKYKS